MAEEERALGRSPRVRIVVVALAAIAGWLDGLTFVALGTVPARDPKLAAA